MDENPLNWDDAKAFNRLRMSTTCVLGRGGWTIGERFDDRFDTEVGGTQRHSTKGEIEGGLPTSMSLNDFAEFPKQPRPPQIVDYQEDKRYTLEEAEAIPELAPVVQRLKERIEEYEREEPMIDMTCRLCAGSGVYDFSFKETCGMCQGHGKFADAKAMLVAAIELAKKQREPVIEVVMGLVLQGVDVRGKEPGERFKAAQA